MACCTHGAHLPRFRALALFRRLLSALAERSSSRRLKTCTTS